MCRELIHLRNTGIASGRGGELTSSGKGPERGTLHEVCVEMVLKLGHWTEGTRWYTPVLTSTLDPSSVFDWRAVGTAMMLNLVVCGRSPFKVHPVFFYLVVAWAMKGLDNQLTADDLHLSLEILEQLDDGSATRLKPWLALNASESVRGMSIASPVPQFLISEMGKLPATIESLPGNRSVEYHSEITSEFVSVVIFNYESAWRSSQLKAAVEGFNVKIGKDETHNIGKVGFLSCYK